MRSIYLTYEIRKRMETFMMFYLYFNNLFLYVSGQHIEIMVFQNKLRYNDLHKSFHEHQ